MKPVLIIGAGGHAKVLADALLASGRQVLGFTAGKDFDGQHKHPLPGLAILGTDDVLSQYSASEIELINGIGGIDCRGLRRRVQETLEANGWHFSGVRHPAALVSPFADIATGAQLMAASVIQPGARIGAGSIINTAAVVEHDAMLDAFVHVAPRAVLCGDTEVGCDSHIGAGAIVRQGVKLGSNTLVGAGAVVVTTFVGQGILTGIPARQRDSR
jgi:sugar O-acyltransferase (sialic acid O-acetyltransferase NeuD family)